MQTLILTLQPGYWEQPSPCEISTVWTVNTHTKHDYTWLNSIGNQAGKYYRESGAPEELSLWGLFGQWSTRSIRTWQREWKDAQNFFQLFPLHLTEIQSGKKNAVHAEYRDRKQSTVTAEQLSRNIHKPATAWRRSFSDRPEHLTYKWGIYELPSLIQCIKDTLYLSPEHMQGLCSQRVHASFGTSSSFMYVTDTVSVT